MRDALEAARTWATDKLGRAYSGVTSGVSAAYRWVREELPTLILFGGMGALYTGLRGFDSRVALIALGLMMVWLAVPRSVRREGDE